MVPSGAVDKTVVSCSSAVFSADLGIADGRAGFGTGLTVDRDATEDVPVAAVELIVDRVLVVAVVDDVAAAEATLVVVLGAAVAVLCDGEVGVALVV